MTVEDPDQPLKRALERATAAERWQLAEDLMAELRERRRMREEPATNIIDVADFRKRRPKGEGGAQ